MTEEQEKTAAVLKQASQLIRGLYTERDGLISELAVERAKTAQYERRTQAEKLAAQMHLKGINTDVEFSSLAAELEKAAEEGRLGTIAEAVDMVGPDMSFKTASINHDVHKATGSDFERFLTGHVG